MRGLDESTWGDGWCVCLIKEEDPIGESHEALNVDMFFTLENWVVFLDSSPQPSIDPQRSLRPERGIPRLLSHAFPLNP